MPSRRNLILLGMPAISYSVVATLPDEKTRSEYVEWLQSGHVDAVVRAGAHTGVILRVEEPASPPQVETRYVFTTREDYERYIRDAAQALRAEGLRQFPPERGIRFERRVAVIV